MKREIRDRWTAALRSGEYQQGRLNFQRGDKFCCLGVLCHVMGQPTRTELGSGNWTAAKGLIGGAMDVHELAVMNDDGVPFAAIADYIDAKTEATR